MSANIHQVYIANPITSNAATDLLYFGQSPYGAGNDAAMTYANFAAQFATSTNANNVATTSTTANATFYPLFVSSSTNSNQACKLNTGLTYNASTDTLTTTTFAGALSGNATTATTATNATNVATTQVSTNASFYPLFVASSTNGNQAADLGTGLTFNPSTNTLTTTTFSGALNGNATTATTATTAGNGFTWNDVSGTSQAAAGQNGYIISNSGQTTVTIPATLAEGQVIAVQGKGAAGWILQANTGQTIYFGSSATSSAGSLTSTNQWDSVTIVCVTANTTFAVTSAIGNLTVA